MKSEHFADVNRAVPLCETQMTRKSPAVEADSSKQQTKTRKYEFGAASDSTL